ncbi:RNA polymerase subunit sigma [Variovorax paradoxus]|jgi:RNA polymerase sigma-70 factor (ECF subfamily)|uniref:sigma-70 family RNA polymerase sigma factor n=1 Tax=Variovorax TaxID=34072 RepID=UPI0006E726DF|nr:sigma-70 family RNA polymerase sigma factor [Variovorax sp. CY25R-8]KPU95816.1 RNA polymerase subunit sigma [Variovorax paradoxus]KPV11213.1 RNA polymerase subunit sigma [Variovorax paradoxus]KPV13122.1 RNA polymerase subunit sigma [Variovorax paradoxus]KPV21230.1 RNA polymerase subunit sigma [Variovorax paradoxus]KPV26795.1 RNA polymerase subunit sigma [Variovorax paradoxus]|eukprot:TRINITY_DN28487_c0_g1_i1.p1 TRINITY_DN28487_c0_g1~~TRINITY_DN28487_c0_g1_i1.p1  ORF type:complete len:184 (+),score=38.34 TRINITY_DN28487_c0_g1_i1:54-605(+)
MKASDIEPVLQALLLRGLDADSQAYQEFLRKMSGYLRGFIGRRLTGWPDDVEDLVQECLLAIHNQRHTYEKGHPVTAWAGAIARYKLIDLLRAKSGREMLHVAIDELDIFDESQAEASEARRDVFQLLETLPDRHRLPILHVKLEGLSVAETARRLLMSESAVKVNVHRGLKMLAAKFQELSA